MIISWNLQGTWHSEWEILFLWNSSIPWKNHEIFAITEKRFRTSTKYKVLFACVKEKATYATIQAVHKKEHSSEAERFLGIVHRIVWLIARLPLGGILAANDGFG